MKARKNVDLRVLAVALLLTGSFFPISQTTALQAAEQTGNCLSWPVILTADDMAFRGTAGTTELSGASYDVYDCDHSSEDPEHDLESCPHTHWYYQQDPYNEWQADSLLLGPNARVKVDWVDWGDNLEARPWKTNSIIRVETVLSKDVDTAMTGYEMYHISGTGIDEMWGTNGVEYQASEPTVYASDAYITVQFMGTAGMPDPDSLTWDPETNTWSGGDAGSVCMDDAFSAEVNVKGKVIHGCSWNARTDSEGEGYYRITMSYESDTKINLEIAQIVVSTEEEASDSGEPAGGVATVDVVNNLTYIDVQIVKATGKGGGGGQAGGGGGSGDGSHDGGSGGGGSHDGGSGGGGYQGGGNY